MVAIHFIDVSLPAILACYELPGVTGTLGRAKPAVPSRSAKHEQTARQCLPSTFPADPLIPLLCRDGQGWPGVCQERTLWDCPFGVNCNWCHAAVRPLP